ncbi:hypothetical protein K503DRAFT_787708 [Rhizopogon vinicolor AM-OR11-026]|uniref:Uncharacterized protein n=1 Tax=Rhizopogon vinicolor AM-OR11-026 TaxID=1314800 RepID=A0A1B7MGA2_9AGAM|nr:hypothetical protein K503DRAFT_787708 [Rhizopogon vinicolor AM-OR11-026]
MAARAAAAKPLRPTPAIPASPRDFVSMLRSLSGTDAPVTGEDDGKGIPDDEGIVAVVPGGRETACGGGARVEGVRVRSNDGRGAMIDGWTELWEGALEGVRVLGAMEDGRGTCSPTGTFSLRPDGVLERDVTLLRWVILEKIRERCSAGGDLGPFAAFEGVRVLPDIGGAVSTGEVDLGVNRTWEVPPLRRMDSGGGVLEVVGLLTVVVGEV